MGVQSREMVILLSGPRKEHRKRTWSTRGRNPYVHRRILGGYLLEYERNRERKKECGSLKYYLQ